MRYTLAILLTIFSLHICAQELKILSWSRLDPQSTQDTSAEVCFSLRPAPQAPTFVQIKVDYNTRFEAYYSAWIAPVGSNCTVVSSQVGRVSVEIPSMKVNQLKTDFAGK